MRVARADTKPNGSAEAGLSRLHGLFVRSVVRFVCALARSRDACPAFGLLIFNTNMRVHVGCCICWLECVVQRTHKTRRRHSHKHTQTCGWIRISGGIEMSTHKHEHTEQHCSRWVCAVLPATCNYDRELDLAKGARERSNVALRRRRRRRSWVCRPPPRRRRSAQSIQYVFCADMRRLFRCAYGRRRINSRRRFGGWVFECGPFCVCVVDVIARLAKTNEFHTLAPRFSILHIIHIADHQHARAEIHIHRIERSALCLFCTHTSSAAYTLVRMCFMIVIIIQWGRVLFGLAPNGDERRKC